MAVSFVLSIHDSQDEKNGSAPWSSTRKQPNAYLAIDAATRHERPPDGAARDGARVAGQCGKHLPGADLPKCQAVVGAGSDHAAALQRELSVGDTR